ncbi:hypothetical protein DID80_01050 [Candidatus Marinamargulisbacteria bacterium SCGC AAA071-K20]|nr:hypothetical protein DID80_01050 [Candidatus Marinamargulisbacteria bacterium SCGC AAA071-K20]
MNPYLNSNHPKTEPFRSAPYTTPKYNDNTNYISISNSDRSKDLDYIATVYNGINLDDFELNEFPEESIVFFGRIHPDKDAKEAIEIAKAVNMPLVMAGIIQDDAYFKEHVEPHIDQNYIKYIGSVGPDQRKKTLKNAKVLLHPISFEEPFGLSVAESMASGTPVIAFNRGSMPELIEHGKTGFIVENITEAISAISKLELINIKDGRTHVAKKLSRPMDYA